jgi:hypothetical protein
VKVAFVLFSIAFTPVNFVEAALEGFKKSQPRVLESIKALHPCPAMPEHESGKRFPSS